MRTLLLIMLFAALGYLLGMNALRILNIEQSGDTLILENNP